MGQPGAGPGRRTARFSASSVSEGIFRGLQSRQPGKHVSLFIYRAPEQSHGSANRLPREAGLFGVTEGVWLPGHRRRGTPTPRSQRPTLLTPDPTAARPSQGEAPWVRGAAVPPCHVPEGLQLTLSPFQPPIRSRSPKSEGRQAQLPARRHFPKASRQVRPQRRAGWAPGGPAGGGDASLIPDGPSSTASLPIADHFDLRFSSHKWLCFCCGRFYVRVPMVI